MALQCLFFHFLSKEINKIRLEASHQVEVINRLSGTSIEVLELGICLKRNGCLNQVEVEQRMWYHIEELQAITTVVHSLENRLIAINQEHEAEMQKHTQEVDELPA